MDLGEDGSGSGEDYERSGDENTLYGILKELV